MNKYLISFLLFGGLLVSVCSAALAQEDVSISIEEELPISISIAQVSEAVRPDVGALPGSSFYWFKELRRGIRKFFAFSHEKKAEIELEIADEKAEELKAVEAQDPNDNEAITKAISNYLDAKELLEARFTSLTKNLNDKNRQKAEEILDKWDEKIDEHRALFDRLADKFDDVPEIKDVTEKLDWITPVAKFRGNLDDLAEQLKRTQESEEFEEAVEEIEDLKEDIEEGVEARGGFRTDCAAIVGDIDALKASLRVGKIDPQDFARQVGVLIDEREKCEEN